MKTALLTLAVAAGLGALAFGGCGSGETTTVTEAVVKDAPKEASTESAEATQGSTPTATTIPDGTWQLGVDYKPGKYRAPGGPTCAWEQDQKLGGEAAGEGFNENYGFGETNLLIEVNSPYFKTEHCGTWVKVE